LEENNVVAWHFYGTYDRFLMVRVINGYVSYIYANYDITDESSKLTDSNDGSRVYAAELGHHQGLAIFADANMVHAEITFELTNAFRAFHGSSALVRNSILDKVAADHCQDMINRDFFAHECPDGTMPWDRMARAGYNFVAAGENLFRGTGLNTIHVFNGWVNSAGHRNAMLNENFTELGVGWAGGTHGAKVFGRPR
jgi:hypothetical protein